MQIINHRQIFSSKTLLSILHKWILLSTKINIIYGANAIEGKIGVNKSFKNLVESNSIQFKLHNDSKKFSGLL